MFFLFLSLSKIKSNQMEQNNLGYVPKDLHFESTDKLIEGVRKLARAVKSTLGASGSTVLIESLEHIGGLHSTKDGVTVAKSLHLLDPIENLAVSVVKQAAIKSGLHAGDGTTTTIVLAEALINEAYKAIQSGFDATLLLREIEDVLKDFVLPSIEKIAIPIDDELLVSVAKVSCNNDEALGKFVSDAYLSVGKDGIVTVKDSRKGYTYSMITNGLRIERGYTSNHFVNDLSNDTCVLTGDVKVLVSTKDLSNILDIKLIVESCITNKNPLLIIAPVAKPLLNTLVANVQKTGLPICVVDAPSMGWKQQEIMSDIAISVGATFFSESTGDDMSLMKYSDLGTIKSVTVYEQETVIEKEGNVNVDERVAQLRVQLENADEVADRTFILQRIAMLTGGVAQIYVGAPTSVEQKEMKDRVDDAVCAVRSAIEEGVVIGGGMALYRILLSKNFIGTAECVVGSALLSPMEQILINAGLDYAEISKTLASKKGKNVGYNVITKKYGDMFKMGIVDPKKVTRLAIENAFSVAKTILTTSAIITLTRSYE